MYYPNQPVTTTFTTVTPDKAVAAIKTAAEEIPPDEFISYSTILDVHLSYALEAFSRDEQVTVLQALKEVLEEEDELARNIAWDLIIVLLPFLEVPSSSPATSLTASAASVLAETTTIDPLTEITQTCLRIAVEKGNPREVFLKILQALSSLNFEQLSKAACPVEDAEGEESCLPLTPLTPARTPSQARENGYRKFKVLIELLGSIHCKISTTFPSRFLSQSLTTLLRAFTRSIESLNRVQAEDIVSQVLELIDGLQPEQTKRIRIGSKQKLGSDGRPALPPRTSSVSLHEIESLKISGDDDTAEEDEEQLKARIEGEEKAKIEEDMQIRLLQSFLTHLVEVYVLRCPVDALPSIIPPSHTHPHGDKDLHLTALDQHEEEESTSIPSRRGLNFHFSSRYLKNRNLVGGFVEAEIKATTSPETTFKRISDLSFQLGIDAKELYRLCFAAEADAETEATEEIGIKSPTLGPIPRFVEDIPLSKTGSLILFCSAIINKDIGLSSELIKQIRIFPEHHTLTIKFLRDGNTSSDVGVIDAAIFLGSLALSEAGGFGQVPSQPAGEDDQFMAYLQIYGLLAATLPSPLLRLLAHTHLSNTLHAHPDEAVRLAYIKDTLEHCPFESLKTAMVGVLKDEIDRATGPNPPSIPSILSTPLVLEELSPFLFPNLSQELPLESGEGTAQHAWEYFEENYSTIMSTANLWLFLLIRSSGELDICGVKAYDNRIEERWGLPLKNWVERNMKGEEAVRGGKEVDLEMVGLALGRVWGERTVKCV